MELRCENGILFGTVPDDGILEVSCRSRRCGKAPGVIVIHRISLSSGEILGTKRFRDYASRKESA